MEAAYQSLKTDDLELRKLFTLMEARQAKKASKDLKVRADWFEVKYAIMMSLLLLKFEDPVLRCKLLETGEEELIEGNNFHDTYWGVCDGVGKNNLGIALMKVRQYIRLWEE